MFTKEELQEEVAKFVERHWPKNDTAAHGGPRTPGRGEAMAVLGMFLAELPDASCQDSPEGNQISPGLSAEIERSLREGVSLGYADWRALDVVTNINWHPGDPNKLAEVVIRNCHGPVSLALDGRKFLIQPA